MTPNKKEKIKQTQQPPLSLFGLAFTADSPTWLVGLGCDEKTEQTN